MGQVVPVRIGLDGLLRIYDPTDPDHDRLPVASYTLRNVQEGWASTPEHHAALWQTTLNVEQRPLQAYEEVTQWN
jgi:hypothetical protein